MGYIVSPSLKRSMHTWYDTPSMGTVVHTTVERWQSSRSANRRVIYWVSESVKFTMLLTELNIFVIDSLILCSRNSLA
jgi:hypothetical protein